ncbi:hypothetical protein BOX15_Mlig014360g3 [Macrostomum lignano]|uniref:Uncharacterized protein n=1 Tax=Macrostomum lignano TaxID=282301 RepID=A0A267G974_9PLAT|nr:hypothetical protein BOX15_Mlig014360g3 [Macrostomum lignano]
MGYIRLALLFTIVLVILIEPGDGCFRKLKGAVKAVGRRVGRVFGRGKKAPKAAADIAQSAEKVGKTAKKGPSATKTAGISVGTGMLAAGTIGAGSLAYTNNKKNRMQSESAPPPVTYK